MRTLRLVNERKIHELVPSVGLHGIHRFEASDIVFHDDLFYLVFDNLTHIARVGIDISTADDTNTLLLGQGNPCGHDWCVGYEAITYDIHRDLFYTVLECRKYIHEHGQEDDIKYNAAMIYKLKNQDNEIRCLDAAVVHYPFEEDNKGLEGLTYVTVDSHTYLLGLCEGNWCMGGNPGREKGQGRIQVLEQIGDLWECVTTMKIPNSVQFKDYSGIDIRGERIAIVSQESSELWIGGIDLGRMELLEPDDGGLFEFPRSGDGQILYGNIEGVAFIDVNHIAVVSDKAKDEQHKRVKEKDESIHIFEIPS